MAQQTEKPLYWDNHEGFRRLLIIGAISLVVGVFFGDQVAAGEHFFWLRGWFPTFLWISGLVALAFCFLLHPRQYSIYPDSLVVEWWHQRRKVIPFDEMTELKSWNNLGRPQIIVISSGPDYDFGWNLLSPRRAEEFAQRLEEAVNRRRFYTGRDPLVIKQEGSRKDKKKEKG